MNVENMMITKILVLVKRKTCHKINLGNTITTKLAKEQFNLIM